jgi:hypothetical protein
MEFRLLTNSPLLMACNAESAWDVVQTYRRYDAKVQLGLQSMGLEIFNPRITVRRCRRGWFRLLSPPYFQATFWFTPT